MQYKEFLLQVKNAIRSCQARAALAVNTELINLYWNIGRMIATNQALFEGRNDYVDQLSRDIKAEFPDVSGFSRTNLFYIRKFYLFYSTISVQQLVGLNSDSIQHTAASVDSDSNVLQAIAKIPWGHHVLILSKIKQPDAALFYIRQTFEYNWSRAILGIQIEQNLYARQGKAISNFKTTLPEQQASMAQQILKDPYNFNFLTLEPQVQELEIEKQLTQHITKFLLELGKGFAFIGRQYHLAIGSKDYYIDLLFYHIRLHSFIVIELKSVEFQPEFAGKLNFYLSAVDDLLKSDTDQPSIGILLCKSKDRLEVEYALRDINKPIGVSEFTFTEALPEELKSSIPTVEEFENELNKLS